MTKVRNKKKTSDGVSPYPLFSPSKASTGEKDGPIESRGIVVPQKMAKESLNPTYQVNADATIMVNQPTTKQMRTDSYNEMKESDKYTMLKDTLGTQSIKALTTGGKSILRNSARMPLFYKTK
jgi:hypothetical protein